MNHGSDGPVWGRPLRERLLHYFRRQRHLKVEAFVEWLPHPLARVTLDPFVRDRYELPVSRINATRHPRSVAAAARLVEHGSQLLGRLGADQVHTPHRIGTPSTNLVGGTCRFGKDPASSVLDPDCRAHEVDNLFVTDGSFMPSGGSAPFTFTIYANALRVAEKIVSQLGGPR